MLQRGDLVPHVDVRTVDGTRFTYSSIWQRNQLVLVALPASTCAEIDTYVSRLMARLGDFSGRDTACVITRDHVPGLDPPAVLVADRWGEIVHAVAAPSSLPAPGELLEWIDYLRVQCPECQGEAR